MQVAWPLGLNGGAYDSLQLERVSAYCGKEGKGMAEPKDIAL